MVSKNEVGRQGQLMIKKGRLWFITNCLFAQSNWVGFVPSNLGFKHHSSVKGDLFNKFFAKAFFVKVYLFLYSSTLITVFIPNAKEMFAKNTVSSATAL